jgi:serine/threonine-protein kinase/endoribonuclease IRE1
MHPWIPSPRRITTFYLLALASAQQQHSQDAHRNSPQENPALRPITANTNPSSKNERAVATFAPAAIEAAVRASPPADSAAARASPQAGLSSRSRGARSLQDWEVENFVLLATVDGSIYARDRNTGQELWKFHTEAPMVETTYHRRSENSGQDSSDPSDDKDQWMWIVEPNQDGSLYVFIPGPGAGIQKLGPTVKELADQLSPWVSEDSPFVYTAEKRNTLITLNATNGAAIKYFSAGSSGFVDGRSCRSVRALEMEEEDECEPTPTINIGRVEYIVSIQDKNSGEGICTIKYFEWTPNNRDKDLQSQYASTMDNKYIYSRYDGGIIAFQHTIDQQQNDNRFLYRKKFASPVVRVFDVARPQGVDSREIPLVLLPQPVAPAESTEHARNVFVNCTETGSWYALSEISYPSVTDGASEAKCYTSVLSDDEFQPQDTTFPLSGLVGVHALPDHSRSEHNLPGIAAPDDHIPAVHTQPPKQVQTKSADKEPLLIDPPKIPVMSNSFYKSTLIALLVAVILILYQFHSWMPYLDLGKKTHFSIFSFEKNSTPEMASKPMIVEEVVKEENAVISSDKLVSQSGQEQRQQSDVVTESAPKPKVTFSESNNSEDQASRESSTDVLLQQLDSNTSNESVSVTHATDPTLSEETPKKKKKTHRGQRGGKKKKLAEQRAQAKLEAVNEGDAVEDIERVAKAVSFDGAVMQPNTITKVDGPIQDVDGRIRLGQLAVFTDKILGYGSGGTVVYEGTFGGIEVAVKRMLLQHFELASQEVEILQQSDHHRNIIRYYYQQKDQYFLYIAVEKCRTNLYDLYQEGSYRDGLAADQAKCVDEINVNYVGALQQLASGLNHLHNLRIIHRDIKPQNILVAYPKKNQKDIRLVISDFGLCRSLPENASTLIGTVANAGTVGWKAPELIGQPKESDGRMSSNGGDPGSSVSNDGTSSGVKRAVDIFSLGCVFFYVLTNGAHPFDKGETEVWQFEREYRIKKGTPEFDKLRMLGADAEEPMDLIEWMVSHRPEDRLV